MYIILKADCENCAKRKYCVKLNSFENLKIEDICTQYEPIPEFKKYFIRMLPLNELRSLDSFLCGKE